MNKKLQSYKNHVHYRPSYHFLTFAAMLALLVGSIYYVVTAAESSKFPAYLILLLVLTLISVSLHSRSFVLRVQDRAIRAEENLRYFILTGKRLPQELSIRQIIALRFASDEEFEGLVSKAIKESLSSDQIKQLVKNWRPDYHRA
jgi:hypothetical protein